MPKFLLIVAVSVLGMIFALLSGGNEERVRAQTTSNTPTPTPMSGELPPLDGKLNPSQYPNMDATLNRMVGQVQTGQMLSIAAAAADAPVHRGEEVAVRVRMDAGQEDDVLDFLNSNGGEPRVVGEEAIEAYVPLSLLPQLAELPGVFRIETVLPPQPAQAGNPVSEAIAVHGAGLWHDAGVRGEGVKIGIIDLDFKGFSRLMGTHLPSSVEAKCYIRNAASTNNPADCENGTRGSHGTLVAEAIYDIAPDADYYIAGYAEGGALNLADAVDWMIAEGVDVINMSVSWSWSGRGDGTSPYPDSPLNLINKAVEAGIVWMNSAGNIGYDHWYGAFSDPDNDGYHNFTVDKNCNRIELEAGRHTDILVRWDDIWTAASRDLDMYLLPRDARGNFTLTGAITSEEEQSGGHGQIPRESISFTPAVGGAYCLAVRHYSGEVPRWIQIEVRTGEALEVHTLHGTIDEPADSASSGLLAVGAANWETPYQIEDYSARGPAPDGRTKPDIVGAVHTYSEQAGGRWVGTSAASPHVAGLAALVKQANPAFTAERTARYMKENALPRGDAPNNIWGYGLARLPSLGGTAPPPPPPAPEPGECSAGTALGNQIANPHLLSDCETLLMARDMLAGSSPLNWSANVPMESWEGITLGGIPLRVAELNLRDIGVSGEIPPALGDLVGLVKLDLYRNELTGTIPPELGNLVNVWQLILGHNRLVGTIPPELGNLVSVVELNFHWNRMTGTIPLELGNLLNLHALHIGHNQFTGCIPESLRSRGVDYPQIGLPFCEADPTPEPSPAPTPEPSPEPTPPPPEPTPDPTPPPTDGFVEVSVGVDHACALHSDGHIECWGANDQGQATPPRGHFVQVESSFKLSCAVREDGEVLCWGSFSVP